MHFIGRNGVCLPAEEEAFTKTAYAEDCISRLFLCEEALFMNCVIINNGGEIIAKSESFRAKAAARC